MPVTYIRRQWAVRAAAVLFLTLAAASAAALPPAEWNFTVRLDGKPIGTHRFALVPDGDGRFALSSDAHYDVTLFGVPVYRYRHRASERWTGGCLAAIEARTDDNGRLAEVRGQIKDGHFELQVRAEDRGSAVPPPPVGCLMSFAYWNPALAGQTHLLDPGSGRVESVAMTVPASVPADLESGPQPVRGLRIGGLTMPIDVWYVGDHWVGLDTTVGGGRRLSYRLR